MRIASLFVYPVKSCRAVPLSTAEVEPWGLAGDRRWMVLTPDRKFVTQRKVPALATVGVRVRADGVLSLTAPGLDPLEVVPPRDGAPALIRTEVREVRLLLAGEPAAAWFGKLCGEPVDLAWLADPDQRRPDPELSLPTDRINLSDAFPVHLVTEASLAELNRLIAARGTPAEAVRMAQMRPNIVLDGSEPWAEDSWVGRTVRIGTVPFRVVRRTERCVVATVDQKTGIKGREPLRVLARHRNIDQELLFGVHLIPDGPGGLRVGDEVSL